MGVFGAKASENSHLHPTPARRGWRCKKLSGQALATAGFIQKLVIPLMSGITVLVYENGLEFFHGIGMIVLRHHDDIETDIVQRLA